MLLHSLGCLDRSGLFSMPSSRMVRALTTRAPFSTSSRRLTRGAKPSTIRLASFRQAERAIYQSIASSSCAWTPTLSTSRTTCFAAWKCWKRTALPTQADRSDLAPPASGSARSMPVFIPRSHQAARIFETTTTAARSIPFLTAAGDESSCGRLDYSTKPSCAIRTMNSTCASARQAASLAGPNNRFLVLAANHTDRVVPAVSAVWFLAGAGIAQTPRFGVNPPFRSGRRGAVGQRLLVWIAIGIEHEAAVLTLLILLSIYLLLSIYASVKAASRKAGISCPHCPSRSPLSGCLRRRFLHRAHILGIAANPANFPWMKRSVNEIVRIREEYEARDRTIPADFYAWHRDEIQYWQAGVARVCARLLRNAGLFPLTETTIADIGCALGNGCWNSCSGAPCRGICTASISYRNVFPRPVSACRRQTFIAGRAKASLARPFPLPGNAVHPLQFNTG